MLKLLSRWESLRSSLWFVPSILVGSAILLALFFIEVDSAIDRTSLREASPRLFGAGADGSRGMLTAIASSMITVAGVAFSITIVALALASSQYTSRILRNFMRDRANQTVLGTFLGIYVYCVVVLRTIRGGDEGAFVPSLAVLFAVPLSIFGIGCLIFFIHHIASSIQAESIIQSASDETLDAIDRLFPGEMGESADADAPEREPPLEAKAWHAIPSLRSGYIQGIDGDGLVHLASKRKTVFRMERGIGEFVVEGAPLVTMGGREELDDETVNRLNALYSIGRQRTTVQDAGFGIRQIVDVALKALSPGINDSTTAVTCVEHLSSILSRLASRKFESRYRMDKGELRVIARGPTFPKLLSESFDQIRRNAAGNVAVLYAMLRAVEIVAGRTQALFRQRALRKQADLVAEVARESIPTQHDREEIEDVLTRLDAALGTSSSFSANGGNT